jgi:hypothetical protein
LIAAYFLLFLLLLLQLLLLRFHDPLCSCSGVIHLQLFLIAYPLHIVLVFPCSCILVYR